ncbi:hypothetical protein ACLOJK_014361 [Asimina triloba]
MEPDKSCLPSCFGISTTVCGSRGTNEKRRFSLWRSRMRKSAVKTAPVDVSGVQKPTRGAPGRAEVEEKPGGKRRIAGDKSSAASVAAAVAPENGTLPPAVDVNPSECASPASKDSTAPRRTAASRPSGQRHDRKSEKLDGRFDPVVGLSVLTVVVAIMLLWGRACAILCTSAWFYFIPRLRATVRNSGEVAGTLPKAGNVDVDSEEYKKKVILEGLLERNRRGLLVTNRIRPTVSDVSDPTVRTVARSQTLRYGRKSVFDYRAAVP